MGNSSSRLDLKVLILGIGNTLLSDEGVGVRVIERLHEGYEFSDHVSIMEGGVLGLDLLGPISEADHLVVVDAVRRAGVPGTLYRLRGDEIPRHFRAKESLHQIGFAETLAACQALGKIPETVIVGVEPEDMETYGLDLTPTVRLKIDDMIEMVLEELHRLGHAP